MLGLGTFAKKVFGTPNDRKIKATGPVVDQINALEADFESLSDEELITKTKELEDRAKAGESLDSLLPEAFANCREAAKRALGLRAFDVQLMGGIFLHQDNIAEMKTGEGKTLVATLPAYLNAVQGNKVVLVTVNDYLAQRDAEWMRRVYEFLGLSVGVIHSNQNFEEKKHLTIKTIYRGKMSNTLKSVFGLAMGKEMLLRIEGEVTGKAMGISRSFDVRIEEMVKL